MRLILELEANGNFLRSEFERKYRTAIHGLCHSFFLNSIFPSIRNIHESGNPGLFCFSGLSGKFGNNGELLSGNKYKLTISSPSGQLFFTLVTNFKRLFLSKQLVELGDAQFRLVGAHQFKPALVKNDVIISDGIVVLTKNSLNRKQFVLAKGTEINKNNLIEPELFQKLFKSNLLTKANQLGLSIADKLDQIPDPEIICITKNSQKSPALTVRMQIKSGAEDYFVVGNRIRITLPFNKSEELIGFEKLMDCGFGVMNGYGFGFMKKVLAKT